MNQRTVIEWETLTHILNDSADYYEANEEIERYLNDGWNIVNIWKHALNPKNGRIFPTVYREIELQREIVEEESREADRLARENHALAMLYADAMSGDELEAEADLADQHYSLYRQADMSNFAEHTDTE